MDGDPQKKIFISYRREPASFIARAVYQSLTQAGYDVFFDVESINSGKFSEIILGQIAARPHFLLILTKGTLERCVNPDDWVRREIETAIHLKRNIIPLLINNFDFGEAQKFLVGDLAEISSLNGINVPHDYFDAAMDKLRTRFLTLPTPAVRPVPPQQIAMVKLIEAQIAELPLVTEKELNAEEYFNEANFKYENGDIEGAIVEYTHSISLNPNHPIAYNNRGNVLFHANNILKAIADYDKAIQLSRNYAQAYHNRGLAYIKQGDFISAYEDFTNAIKLGHSEVYLSYNNRGNISANQRNWLQAIEDYNQAIKLNSTDSGIYLNRGIAYHKQMNLKAAIEDYTYAIRLNPYYAEAYNNRGIAQKEQGDLESAIKDYNQAIFYNPNFADTYNNRGIIYQIRGELAQAILDYNKAIELEPNNAPAYTNLGEAFFLLGQYTEAIKNFQKSNNLYPAKPIIIAGMAITYFKLNNLTEAARLWQEVLVKLDSRYQDPDWVGKELDWMPPLIKTANELIAKL